MVKKGSKGDLKYNSQKSSKNKKDSEQTEKKENSQESGLEKELAEKENKKDKEKEKRETSDKDNKKKGEDSEKEVKEKNTSEKEIRVDENPNKMSGKIYQKTSNFSDGWSLDAWKEIVSEDKKDRDKEEKRENISQRLEDNLWNIVPFNSVQNKERGSEYDTFDTGYKSNNYENRNYQERREKPEQNYLPIETIENFENNFSSLRRRENPALNPGARKSAGDLETHYVIDMESGGLKKDKGLPSKDRFGNPNPRKLNKNGEGMYEIN